VPATLETPLAVLAGTEASLLCSAWVPTAHVPYMQPRAIWACGCVSDTPLFFFFNTSQELAVTSLLAGEKAACSSGPQHFTRT